MLKRQKTYLAQEPEAAGWAREGIPTGLSACDLGGGPHSPERSDVGSVFIHCAGCPGLELPNGLHIIRNPRGYGTAGGRTGQRGSQAVTQRNSGRLTPASVGAARGSLRGAAQLPGS